MKDKLIFGSRAMKHWFPDLKREPNDLDVITREEKMSRDEQYYWVPTFEKLLEINKDDTYLDPDLLITVKTSHLGWDIQWGKTVSDIIFLKNKGCKVDKKLYNALVKDWTEVHGKKWASLKGKDADTFFVDAVKRKYVHDDIHDAVAVYDKQMGRAHV